MGAKRSMKNIFNVMSLSSTLGVGLLLSSATYAALSTAPLNFIIIGDTGTGTAEQYQVADAIKKVCDQKSCMFAIGMGDNIYEWGPNSDKDQQFTDKFEKPYANLNFPFFMALGNHDQSITFPGDGIGYWKGYYEVNYKSSSNKWKMPARYYQFDAKNTTSNAMFIAYDSNPMKTYLPQLVPYWWPKGGYMQQQKSWIDKSIAASSATWKFAFAHHPYKTNGKEVIYPAWWSSQAEFAESSFCGKVDMIFAGHIHAMEALDVSENCGAKKTTAMLNSGAAAKASDIRRSPEPYKYVWDTFNKPDLGFMLGEINGRTLNVTAYVLDAAKKPVIKWQKIYTK